MKNSFGTVAPKEKLKVKMGRWGVGHPPVWGEVIYPNPQF